MEKINAVNTRKTAAVCLVDDDQDDRTSFAETLWEVDSAADLMLIEGGAPFMGILSACPESLPQLIFLNINMPCCNGFECLEKIRQADGVLKKSRVIMYSTSSSQTDIAASRRLGADLYVVKPLSFNALKNVIRKILSLQRERHKGTKREDFLICGE